MSYLLLAYLMIWALGLFTSISVISVCHVLAVVPALYFIGKNHYRSWTLSMWALLAFVFALVLSVVANLQTLAPGILLEGMRVKYFLIALFTIAPFVYYQEKLFSERNIKIILWLVLISSLVAAISGLIAMRTGFNPLKMKAVPDDRNYGLFSTLMVYAHALGLFMVLLTGALIYKSKLQKYIPVWVVLVAWVINGWSLYLTYTRGAWIAFAVALPFFFLKSHPKKFVATGFAVVILSLGMWFLVPKVRNIFLERQQSSDSIRVEYWQAAIKAFEEKPVFGIGFQNFEPSSLALKKKYGIGNNEFQGHAHSNFFEVLATSGAVGFIAFLAWIFLWFAEMWKRNDFVAQMTLPFVVAFFIGGLTQVTLFNAQNLVFIMTVYSFSQMLSYQNVFQKIGGRS